MSGSYRTRRQYGLEPEPSQSALPEARPMSTIPSEDELSHVTTGYVLEYQPEEEDNDDNRSPPRSPLISTVSKGLQALTKKMGYVPKPKKSGDTPRSSAPPKIKEPKSDKKPKKPEPKQPESLWRVFVEPGSNDDNEWPNGMWCIGKDPGTDGYHYYEDRRGVRYRTALGRQFGYVVRVDGKYRDLYRGPVLYI